MSKPTKTQSLKKLELLVEQVRKHCRSFSIETIVFAEVGENGETAMAGYYSPAMIRALVGHIAMNHHQEMAEVIKMISESQKKSSLLGPDGAPATPDISRPEHPSASASEAQPGLTVVSRGE